MPKKTAVKTDVELSTNPIDADGNKTGKWNILVGPIMELSEKVKTDKGPPIMKADVNLIYMGGSNGSPSVPLPPVMSVISLTPPGATKAKNKKYFLLEGDQKDDPYGNILKVSDVSEKLLMD